MRRSVAILLPVLLLAGCAAAPGGGAPGGGQREAPTRLYTGELDVYLEPYDDKGACSITIGLRNTSGVRQGEARLQLAWLNAQGAVLADQSLRMDGLLPGRYDAKNLALPLKCERVSRLQVRSAEWTLFEGWDDPQPVVVPIEGAHATEWRLAWDATLGVFVGKR